MTPTPIYTHSMLSPEKSYGPQRWVLILKINGGTVLAVLTVDGSHVYALAAKGELVCAKVADGSIVWKKELIGDFGGKVPGWGYCESVLVDGDNVICTPGGKKGLMVALNKKNGKTVWSSEAFPDGAQYSSIIPIVFEGVRQYVQLTQKALSGVRASDGKLLWQSPWTGRTAVIPTPIYADGHVYISLWLWCRLQTCKAWRV